MVIRLVFAGAMRACNVLYWEPLAFWLPYIPLNTGEQTVVLLPRSPSPSKRYFPIPMDSLEEEYRIRSADDGKLFREEFNVSRVYLVWTMQEWRSLSCKYRTNTENCNKMLWQQAVYQWLYFHLMRIGVLSLQSLPCYYHHGSFEEASREHNREKNRYPNILPCEWGSIFCSRQY